MAELKDKISNALNESRILGLVVQVVLGFEFQSAFLKLFDQLPRHSRLMTLAAASLALLALALAIAPTSFHRLCESGRSSERQHRFTTAMAGASLPAIAAALALDFFIGFEKVLGRG